MSVDGFSPEFFLHATGIICGSTDMHRMLHDLLAYLSGCLPLDALALSRFEEDKSAVHRFALCHRNGAEEGESLEKIPDGALQFACEVIHSGKRCVLTESAADNPVRSHMHDCGRSRFQSAVVLHLHQEGRYCGSVDMFSEHARAFSEHDARVLEQLSTPFTLFLTRYLDERSGRLRDTVRETPPFPMVGASAAFRRVCEMARDVAPTVTPVLITGETGTGKEVMADYIRHLSDRANAPYIKVNCAAIPPDLLENEFFGHEANAFTGAGRLQKGRFERAGGGTLFLDEIGELTPGAQAKLLRVLEYKDMERLGGSDSIHLDIRILAATNRDLAERVREGQFRRDLYYRLNVFPLHLPPLRERRQDIPALVRFLLRKKKNELGLALMPEPSADDLRELAGREWPGNIRELSNLVERALILAQRTGELHFAPEEDAPCETPLPCRTAPTKSAPSALFPADAPVIPLRDMERAYILHALRRANGKLTGKNSAAEMLDINGGTLRSRMVRLGLDPKKRAD